MNAQKIYSVEDVLRIRHLARSYGVEEFGLDLLCEGLTVDQAKDRLRRLDEKIRREGKGA